MLCKKAVLKNFAKLTGQHLQSLFNKVAGLGKNQELPIHEPRCISFKLCQFHFLFSFRKATVPIKASCLQCCDDVCNDV